MGQEDEVSRLCKNLFKSDEPKPEGTTEACPDCIDGRLLGTDVFGVENLNEYGGVICQTCNGSGMVETVEHSHKEKS